MGDRQSQVRIDHRHRRDGQIIDGHMLLRSLVLGNARCRTKLGHRVRMQSDGAEDLQTIEVPGFDV